MEEQLCGKSERWRAQRCSAGPSAGLTIRWRMLLVKFVVKAMLCLTSSGARLCC